MRLVSRPVALIVRTVMLAGAAGIGFAILSTCATRPAPPWPPPASVPLLVGLSTEQARTALSDLGVEVVMEPLDEAELRAAFGDDHRRWPQPDTVVGQDPPAGTLLLADRRVVLRVARRDLPIGFTAQVPNLVGDGVEKAFERLTSMGYEVEVIAVDSLEPESTVLSLFPPPGTPLGLGETVRVTISAPPTASRDDSDGDGVPDDRDRCPGTPPGVAADSSGCPTLVIHPTPTPIATVSPTPTPAHLPLLDTDEDGVPDTQDRCPGTLAGSNVDEYGCSDGQLKDKLPLGTYAFNTPPEMVEGTRPYLVTLILTPKPELGDTAARSAVVMVLEDAAPDQRHDPIRIEVARYSGRMKAVLTGPERWSVVPQAGSAGVRLISGSEPTEWRWDVVPHCDHPRLPLRGGELQCDTARLSLAVLAYLKGDDPDATTLLSRDIVVRVTAGHVVRDQLDRNWSALLTALLVPLVAWVARRLWRRRRQRQVRVLFLAANPAGTGHLQGLDDEVRAIDEAIRKAEYRDLFKLEQHWAVRATELDDFLLRHDPHIVHFSGHGSPTAGLMFELAPAPGGQVPGSPQGSVGVQLVPAATLGRLFGALKGKVRCVVLSSCFSENQARVIAQHVGCVIGMAGTISDSAALCFAEAFYTALAYGKDVQTAFALACEAAGCADFDAENAPRLVAHGVDPAKVVFVTGKVSGPPEA